MPAKAAVALVYAFSAWTAAAFCVYAGDRLIPGSGREFFHYLALAGCYMTAFRLYFSRPGGLRPLPAAALTVAFIAALDWMIIAPHLPGVRYFFLSFWDWQLPALLVFASILWAGQAVH